MVPDDRVLMLQSPQYWAVAQRRAEGLFKLTTRPKDGGAARLLQSVVAEEVRVGVSLEHLGAEH